MVAVGNAFCAFSKERWTRSWRPRFRQLPQAGVIIELAFVGELGHLVESAVSWPVLRAPHEDLRLGEGGP